MMDFTNALLKTMVHRTEINFHQLINILYRATEDRTTRFEERLNSDQYQRCICYFYWVLFCFCCPAGGEARKNGLLTVQFRPTFEKMPTIPIWSWNAQAVNLTCVAESIPNATIKWR